MVLIDEYCAVAWRMQTLIDELDRLQLTTVAVHVDLALNRLKNIIAVQKGLAPDLNDNS